MDGQFDVFLSYNGKDKEAARKLYEDLRAFDLSVWLDQEQLVPGRRWQPELDKGIRNSGAIAVLVGADGQGPWQDFETQRALTISAGTGKPVIPVLLPTARAEPDLPPFLTLYTWVDLHHQGGVEQLVWGITGKRPEPTSARPSRRAARPREGGRRGGELSNVLVLSDHRDEDTAKQLRRYLKQEKLEKELRCRFDFWDDRRAFPEGSPNPLLDRALSETALVLGLISKGYLDSVFARPELLRDRVTELIGEGVTFIALLLEECQVEQHPWLRKVPVLPRRGETVRKDLENQGDEAFSDLAGELRKTLGSASYRPSRFEAPAEESIYLDPLPKTGLQLFGREEEISRLRKYSDDPDVRLIVLRGGGGTGKTALLNHWLAWLKAENYRSAHRVFGWSFFSQVKSESASTKPDASRAMNRPMSASDRFVQDALAFFGHKGYRGHPWERGEHLAGLVAEGGQEVDAEQRPRGGCRGWLDEGSRSSLLILDALEALQSSEKDDYGRVTDPAVETLLRSLAAGTPEGSATAPLCVVTTRRPLLGFKQHAAVREIILDHPIDAPAGRDLLRLGRIRGTDKELEDLSAKYGNFPLALDLLVAYLRSFAPVQEGTEQIRYSDCSTLLARIVSEERNEQPDLARHVQRVLEAFIQKLREGGEHEVLEAAGMLSLFDGPVGAQELGELRGADPVEHLNQHLSTISEDAWKKLIGRMRKMRLLSPAPTGTGDACGYPLDVHPLIREYVKDSLMGAGQAEDSPWRKGHSILYDFYLEQGRKQASRKKGTTQERQLPRNQTEALPFFRAVVHGCLAGKYVDAWWDVFWKWIRYGFRHHAGNQLGLWSTDRALLSNFFARLWDEPRPELEPLQRGLALNEAAFDLRALGQLTAAIEPAARSCKEFELVEDWRHASIAAANMYKVLLPLGRVAEASSSAKKAVGYIDQAFADPGNPQRSDEQDDKAELEPDPVGWMVAARAWWADALRHEGRFWESEATFRRAEAIQQRYSKGGALCDSDNYRYCQLLLDQAKMVGKGWVDLSDTCLLSSRGGGIPLDLEAEEGVPDSAVLARFEEVRRRLAEPSNGPDARRGGLDEALRELGTGRAWLLESSYLHDRGLLVAERIGELEASSSGRGSRRDSKRLERRRKDLEKADGRALKLARRHLEKAVPGLEQQGHQIHLARAYLTRAALWRRLAQAEHEQRRDQNDEDYIKKARTDLHDALEIATRDRMLLFEVDYHLEHARLQQALYTMKLEARYHSEALLSVADAEALIASTGYGRRTLEIRALREQLESEAMRPES